MYYIYFLNTILIILLIKESTILISKGIVYSGANLSDHRPGNTELGSPKFHVPPSHRSDFIKFYNRTKNAINQGDLKIDWWVH